MLAAYNLAWCSPAAAISRVDATTLTLQLSWNPVSGAAGYEVWDSVNAPYFAPGATCAGNPDCTAVTDTTHMPAALGDPNNNHTFVVLSSPRCSVWTAAAAYRTGEFDFALTPGQ